MKTTEKHDNTAEDGSGKIPLQRLVMPDSAEIINSYELHEVDAFSLARVWNDNEVQHLNDIWPSCACEFYQSENLRGAMVFDPCEEIKVDGETMSWGDYFQGWDDDDVYDPPVMFFKRKAKDITSA